MKVRIYNKSTEFTCEYESKKAFVEALGWKLASTPTFPQWLTNKFDKLVFTILAENDGRYAKVTVGNDLYSYENGEYKVNGEKWF